MELFSETKRKPRKSSNYQEESTKSTDKAKQLLAGSKMEAETYFLSPYWDLSYNFPWNPDPLCSGNNYSTYDEMREDDQVKASLTIKKDLIVNTGWKIMADDGNEEAIDFITENLEQLGEFRDSDESFDEALRNMLTHFDYGFSLTEPVYEIKEGKIHLKDINTRAPHSFKFYMSDKGILEKITQMTGYDEKVIEPEKIIHHVYQMDFGNPYGKSDLRSAYNAWKAKKFFNRMFAMYVERFSSPTGVIKYPSSYNTNDIAELQTLLTSIKNTTNVLMPDDVMIDFLQAKTDASDAYLKGLDYYNKQIARSILMPDLLGLGGTDTQGGSYALGKEQFKLFLGILKKEREALARKITIRLVRPLALYNFGDFPIWFEFNPWQFEDIKEYLSLWIQATTGKIYKPSDEEVNYFRSSIGFPEGEVERPAAPPPSPFGNPFGGNNDKPEENNNEEQKEEPEEESEEEEMEEEKEFAFNRKPNQYEKKVDFALIEKTMDKNEERITKKLNTSARIMYSDLINQVREKGLLTKFNPDKFNKIKPKYLKDMNKLFKNYYNDLFTESYNMAKDEVFPEEKDKKFAIELLPEEFIELIDQEAFDMVGKYAFNTTEKVKQMVRQGIKDGYSQSEIVKLIRDEIQNDTEIWMNTVVRTKSTEIFNEARKKYYETDEQAKQVVTGYQWSAILDDRTSEICKYLDGKIFPIGELSDRVKPPAHFNCRSVLVPMTKFEDYKNSPKGDFDESKLENKGGQLLVPGIGRRRNLSMEYTELVASKVIETYGDHIMLTHPGEGKNIEITSIFAANLDLDKPVMVACKVSTDIDYQYSTVLSERGGRLDKTFQMPWKLPKAADFVVYISAPVRTEITIRYYITNDMPEVIPNGDNS